MRELIVDNFAGGGGASTGIEMALGISPDFAINHNPVALAMHEANHPSTLHLCNNVWQVDPDEIKGPIGLGWFSPDYKHFSKAKGGKPVEKGIRDLAWVVVRWAKRREGGPRIIMLENVEEFRTWGPLGEDGRPCPDRKGETFKAWIRELKRAGYGKIEWRELRACDYGAPTIRKRLFLIARRDGEPIVWPNPTHGNPKIIAAAQEAMAKGDRRRITLFNAQLQPWRTAAEIMDFSLPCPSIFDTSEEIMAKFGVRAVRPLKPASMGRIAKGTDRYTVRAAEPYIVNLTHHGGDRCESMAEPVTTVTGAHRGEKAFVRPFLARTAHGEMDRNGKRRGQGVHSLDDPFSAVLGSPDHALITPFVAGVGGRMAQSAERCADQPLQTITAKADSVLVAPHLTKFRKNSVGTAMDEPVATVTANSYIDRPGGAAPIGLVSAHMMTMRNAQKPFNEVDRPTHTITAGGAHMHLVSAFLAQNNIDGRTGEGHPGRGADEPVSTILQSGSHQGLVAANLLRQFGTSVGASLEGPTPTVMPEGAGKTQLSVAFLSKYYGTGEGQSASEPAHTVTTKDRLALVEAVAMLPPFGPEHEKKARAVADLLRSHGLWDDREFVTFELFGITVVITDIGLRMLTPRELFRAQGFPDSYVIDTGIFHIGEEVVRKPISKTDQVSKCGNSVSPPMAAALVAANFAPREIEPTEDEPPLFLQAVE